MNLQALQLPIDLTVALGELCADEIEHIQRLLERKQMLCAPVALQAFCDLVSGSTNAHILHRGQHLTIALPGDNGAQNFLPRLADHVRDDVGELDVHLRDRLLHALHMRALASQKHPALAPQRAQYANGFGRAKCAAKQTVGHKLLQSLAVQHIRLAARDILNVTRIDQKYFETA